MYLEKKWNNNYLIKKVLNKKISVNIWTNFSANNEELQELSFKEFEYIKNLDSYLNFKDELFNKDLLDNIYKDTVFLSNTIIQNDSKYIDFPIKFIYESNKTEGSKIPFESVQEIIKQKKYTYKVKNEILEVENSIKVWDFINNDFLFNEANIKKLYHILTNWLIQENWNKYPRWFKKVPIVVNNNTTSSPENVSFEIKNLISDYKNNIKLKNPLKLAFDFHLKYEQIHPFENWNWRTWRFLLNKILLSNWLLPMIVFESNRQAYFNSIDSAKSWDKKKYYKFMLEQYRKTLDEYWKK